MKITMKGDMGVADKLALLVLGSRGQHMYLHMKHAKTHVFVGYFG